MTRLVAIAAALRSLATRRKAVVTNLLSSENVKIVAYELARLRSQRAGGGAPNAAATAPPADELSSLVCCSDDWTSAWLPYWAGRMGLEPALHRKLWEFAFIAQVLSRSGMLRAGARGLGFGCGKEPLASLFVQLGCDVLATDLEAADARARAWAGEQHADSMESIWMPELCRREDAMARLRFRSLDMNAIPAELDRTFDFCWSSCALEHLGSIEQGIEFIRRSARCLRPGGVGVHTTEFNIDPGRTIERGSTVLFQMRHFDELAARLQADGIEMSPILLRDGDPFLDGYVDVPPYPSPSSVGSTLSVLHLRLFVGSFRTTSIGIVFRVE